MAELEKSLIVTELLYLSAGVEQGLIPADCINVSDTACPTATALEMPVSNASCRHLEEASHRGPMAVALWLAVPAFLLVLKLHV